MQEVSPIPIMHIMNINKASSALVASVQLGIFPFVAQHQPLSVSDIAEGLNLSVRGTDTLVVALCSIDLLQVDVERQYRLTPSSEKYLLPSGRDYIGHIIELEGDIYITPSVMIEAVKSGRPQAYESQDLWDVHGDDFEKCKHFTKAMHSTSKNGAVALTRTLDLSRFSTLLDIGGGSGVYCMELLLKYEHMTAILMDIPAACAAAKELIQEYEVSVEDRIKPLAADMFSPDAYPDGFDLALFGQVLHDWPYETCISLLQTVYERLPVGGAVMIMEKVLNELRDGPVMSAMINIDMLFWCTGRQFTVRELTDMLVEVGFCEESVEATPMGEVWTCVMATKM